MINNPWVVAELILYFGGMLAIGWYYSRKEMTRADYHLGGKKLPGWILALSERSTGESAWLILGLPGLAFTMGLAAVWVAAGCVTGIVLAWMFLAREFRREADKYGTITYIDYFAAKYPRRALYIRWYASVIIVFFYVLYVAAQFKGGGKTLLKTFDLPAAWGLLITAVVVMAYASAGGFFSVVWTDAIQAVLMILTFIVTPLVMLGMVVDRGISVTGALAAASVPGKIALDSWTGGMVGLAMGAFLFLEFSWVFGYLGGQPQLSTRWMAMKDDRSVKTGMWVAILWTLFAYLGALAIGWLALALYGPKSVADPELILPHALLMSVPPWLSGILLVGAIAAIMSTASSLLLITTSAVTEDLYHKALGRQGSDRTLVRLSRLTLLAVGAVALAIAHFSGEDIYRVVSWVWAGIGCSFSPAVLCAFFWKRTSSAGILASMVSGFVATVVSMTTGLDRQVTSRFSTFVVSMAAIILFSLAFPDREKDGAGEARS